MTSTRLSRFSRKNLGRLPVLAMLLLPAVIPGSLADENEGASWTLDDGGVDDEGYTIRDAAHYESLRPRGASYWYLVKGVDGIRIPGPTLTFASADEALAAAQPNGSALVRTDHGFDVRVNDRLRFEARFQDFEDEVGLSQVRLTARGAAVETEFTFVAIGTMPGVAHDAEIASFLDGSAAGATQDLPGIEVRPSREAGHRAITIRVAGRGECYETFWEPYEVTVGHPPGAAAVWPACTPDIYLHEGLPRVDRVACG